jgi:hypothetical protein
VTTINLKAASICAGGNHIDMRVSLNGAERASVTLTPDDIIGAPTNDELRSAVAILLRAYKVGRTLAEVRAAVLSQNGIEVVL